MQFHGLTRAGWILVHEVRDGGELRFVIQADGRLIEEADRAEAVVPDSGRDECGGADFFFALPADVGPEVSRKRIPGQISSSPGDPRPPYAR